MKRQSIYFVLVLFALFLNSCKYDFIMPEEVSSGGNPGGQPVSFSTQIVPIFTTGNKCTSCHTTGGQAPDLTAANAYSQLGSKYVNTASPESSLIYTFPAPTATVHTWKMYTASEAGLILTWIKEGAKNN